MRLFHYLIDAMAVNSFVIHKESIGEEGMKEEFGLERSHRRHFLQSLAIKLMKPEIENRSSQYKNCAGLSTSLQQSFKVCGHPIMPQKATHERREGKRSRCYKCARDTDKKTTLICSKCSGFVCKEHSQNNICCEPECS